MKGEEGYGQEVVATESPSLNSFQGEFDFLNRLRQRAVLESQSSQSAQSSNVGIGDDAAVVRFGAGKDTVISTDLLVEGIDFRRTTAPPNLLGHKALAVSLSDIAAMGARPRQGICLLLNRPRPCQSVRKGPGLATQDRGLTICETSGGRDAGSGRRASRARGASRTQVARGRRVFEHLRGQILRVGDRDVGDLA